MHLGASVCLLWLFVCVCPVCALTFESLHLETSFFGTQLHLQNIFVYKGDRSKKVKQV